MVKIKEINLLKVIKNSNGVYDLVQKTDVDGFMDLLFCYFLSKYFFDQSLNKKKRFRYLDTWNAI